MTDIIKELLGKLSRYEILNNLLPGMIMVYILNHIGYDIELAYWWQNALIAYVAGLVCGRVSSLLLEPLCEKCKLINKQEYANYNKTKESRPFVVTLVEIANMYRTLSAVFLIAIVAIAYKFALCNWEWIRDFNSAIQLAALFVLFILSYAKQYGYVVKNIKDVINNQDKS